MADTVQERAGRYSIAGILVRTLPGEAADVTSHLAGLPGVDIHHQEIATGRLVITLEACQGDEEREGLERVRGAVGVISADLVYHYVAPPDEADESLPASIAGAS
jgi:nitrate reductase NapAB chaperone NapD